MIAGRRTGGVGTGSGEDSLSPAGGTLYTPRLRRKVNSRQTGEIRETTQQSQSCIGTLPIQSHMHASYSDFSLLVSRTFSANTKTQFTVTGHLGSGWVLGTLTETLIRNNFGRVNSMLLVTVVNS